MISLSVDIKNLKIFLSSKESHSCIMIFLLLYFTQKLDFDCQVSWLFHALIALVRNSMFCLVEDHEAMKWRAMLLRWSRIGTFCSARMISELVWFSDPRSEILVRSFGRALPHLPWRKSHYTFARNTTRRYNNILASSSWLVLTTYLYSAILYTHRKNIQPDPIRL